MRPIPFSSYWRSTSIVKNLCCQEDAPLLNFSGESAENKEKQQKVATPLLFDHLEQALSNALSWNKISHMKLQGLKMFKTTKDVFYKQFDFFANWQGRLWSFVNFVLLQTWRRDVTSAYIFFFRDVFTVSQTTLDKATFSRATFLWQSWFAIGKYAGVN